MGSIELVVVRVFDIRVYRLVDLLEDVEYGTNEIVEDDETP